MAGLLGGGISFSQLQINPTGWRSAVLQGIHRDFLLAPQADRDGGKVEIPILDFHFPTVPIRPLVLVLLGEKVTVAGAVGMWKSPPVRFPSVGGNGRKPAVGFPPFPQRVISTALFLPEG
jgi:hypothetical protein